MLPSGENAGAVTFVVCPVRVATSCWIAFQALWKSDVAAGVYRWEKAASRRRGRVLPLPRRLASTQP